MFQVRRTSLGTPGASALPPPGLDRPIQTATPVAPAAPSARARLATIHGRVLRASGRTVASPSAPLSAIHRSSPARSSALCHRSSGSFARHGARGGRAPRAGAARRRTGRAPGSRRSRPASPPERPPPRHHLVQHAAQREDVRLRRPPPSPRAAPAPCRHRPQDAPCRGQRRAGRRTARQVRMPLARPQLRQPEVEELRARPREHHVAGLEIAVHDAGGGRRPGRRRPGRRAGARPQRQRPSRSRSASVSPSRSSITR